MKKIYWLFSLLLLVVLFPSVVSAVNLEDYKTENLTEVFKDEDITLKNKKYKETDDQAIIYMFRGSGCGFCHAFLDYLNELTETDGKYFKLVAFEVWGDQKNSKLLDEVAEFTEEDAGGVPYIIIGDKVFPGYMEEWNDDIKDAIHEQYESKNSYDVFKEMNKAEKKEQEQAGAPLKTTIMWTGGIVAGALIILIIVCSVQYSKLSHKLSLICDSLGIIYYEVQDDGNDEISEDKEKVDDTIDEDKTTSKKETSKKTTKANSTNKKTTKKTSKKK